LAAQLKALPSIPVVRRASVFLAQMVKTKHLLELLSHPAVRAPVFLAGRATLAAALRRRPGSHRRPVTRRRLVARLRGSAAEYSLDFRF
jgi:hypothetical protein